MRDIRFEDVVDVERGRAFVLGLGDKLHSTSCFSRPSMYIFDDELKLVKWCYELRMTLGDWRLGSGTNTSGGRSLVLE